MVQTGKCPVTAHEERRIVSQTRAAGRRPALVTFAAILLFLLGGFQLVVAITEFFRYAFGTLPPLAGNYNFFWGALDVLYALVLLYAGYAILQGQPVGRTVALIVAVFAAIRWFFLLWYIPWAAALVIGICLLVIYAMSAHEDYFFNG
jgi:uncharacterized membrane protein (DUF373 family)